VIANAITHAGAGGRNCRAITWRGSRAHERRRGKTGALVEARLHRGDRLRHRCGLLGFHLGSDRAVVLRAKGGLLQLRRRAAAAGWWWRGLWLWGGRRAVLSLDGCPSGAGWRCWHLAWPPRWRSALTWSPRRNGVGHGQQRRWSCSAALAAGTSWGRGRPRVGTRCLWRQQRTRDGRGASGAADHDDGPHPGAGGCQRLGRAEAHERQRAGLSVWAGVGGGRRGWGTELGWAFHARGKTTPGEASRTWPALSTATSSKDSAARSTKG
jgi:hypothetical protein